MNILQVCAYAAKYGGNFIASLMALEEDLKKKGHNVSYLFPESARKYKWCKDIEKEHRVFYCGINRFSVKTFLKIRCAMKNMDIVHSHFELYDMLVSLAAKKKQRIVWHLHDSFDENLDYVHRIINRLQYRMLSKNILLVSPNEYYANYVVKLGFPERNIRLAENCIDLTRLKQTKKSTVCYDFLVFGGFYYIKGLDILLDACRILKSQNKEFLVGIVGYHDTWEWINMNYSDVKSKLYLIEPTEEIVTLYDSTKVFLSTSRRECFSYALLEALSLGKPVIISDIPGNSWASKYETVFKFENENAEELARRMIYFIENNYEIDDELLSKTGKEVRKRYSIDNWIKKIEEVYFG